MKNIYINGCGSLSSAGNTSAEIFDTLSGKRTPDFTEKRKYTSVFEKSEMRRMTDYAKLAAEVSAKCAYDAGFNNIKSQDNSNMGIIFTTGFGASVSNIKFFKSVAKKEPDLCNPMTFASMVPNYSLGNVCILLGIKGYSTTLLGGNPFDIALPVLKRDKVQNMIVGAQEEYCLEFFDSVNAARNKSKAYLPISECAVSFMISCNKSKSCYAEILKSGSSAIPAFSVLSNKKYLSGDELWNDIYDIIQNENPDAVFGIGESILFGECEKTVIDNINKDILYIGDTRKYFGETLGCSFFAAVLSASICLKNKFIHFVNMSNPRKILVTGVDIQGNYMYVLLNSVKEEFEYE